MKRKNYDRYQQLRSGAHRTGAQPSGYHLRPKRIDVTHTVGAPHVEPQLTLRQQVRRQWHDLLRRLDGRLLHVRRAYLALAAIPAFAAGALLGLVVLGWWLFPVQWVDAGLGQLRAEDRALYIQLAADMYSIDNNVERAQRVMAWDTDGTAVCRAVGEATNPDQAARLAYLVMAVREEPCDE
ncbi:MAG: hypothetical protein H6661_09980 [Ardenticatenaceae bacterium]|nr:hypothetical protein [Ardenticatenaceae bacterium]